MKWLSNQGYLLIVITAVAWSGNAIVGRGVVDIVPPVGLAFWRWVAAFPIFLIIAGAVLAAGKAAFMVIEDESKAQNIWARKRLKFDSELVEIERNSDEFNAVCDAFADTHGPTMGLIRDFSDFHLLRLRPRGGVMVLGFAQAYRLSGEALDVTEHLRSG